jgi:CheY-like chemotaxis protein/HPt (histidine-containing phosphotransfer) domain-containing protein
VTELRRRLLATHRPELAQRVEELEAYVAEHGADSECARRCHALKGAALTVGIDGLAVAVAAIEAACDEEGGDVQAARRALEVARHELREEATLDARVRHDLRGSLNIVVGHASLLELESLTPSQRASVAEILAAADTIAAALNALEPDPGADAETEQEATPSAPVEAGVSEAGRALAPERPLHVLVVEDDRTTGVVLDRMLAALGATAEVAGSGAVALERALARPPDLVILDLGLPDTDGRDLLRAFRAHGSLADVPIAVSSGEGGSAVGRELAEDGATALVPKPVTLDTLRTLLLDL